MVDMIEVKKSIWIRRPVEEVRSQFMDLEYHATQSIHPGIEYRFPSGAAADHRVRVSRSLLGRKLFDDEYVNRTVDDGDMISEVVAGTNVGMWTRTNFRSAGEGCRVDVHLHMPVRGAMRFFAPLLRRVAQANVEKGLEEDREELESGRYRSYVDARAAKPAA